MRYDARVDHMVRSGSDEELVWAERLDEGTYDRHTDIAIRTDDVGEVVHGLHGDSIKEAAVRTGTFRYAWRLCETGRSQLRVQGGSEFHLNITVTEGAR